MTTGWETESVEKQLTVHHQGKHVYLTYKTKHLENIFTFIFLKGSAIDGVGQVRDLVILGCAQDPKVVRCEVQITAIF